MINCDSCDYQTRSSIELELHRNNIHRVVCKRNQEDLSSTSSPPHKKHVSFVNVDDAQESDQVMLDVEAIPSEDLYKILLNK